MANNKNRGGASAGTPSVADLAKQATEAANNNHQALIERRQELVGTIETAVGDVATIDSTLASLGFDGDLPAINIDGVSAQPTTSGASATSDSDGARGSKSMPLEEAICYALASSDAGLPRGDGMSLSDIAAAVQSEAVGYTFSGNPKNVNTLISQRMSGLIDEGSVVQVAIEGRSRGLPFRLTSDGRKWVNANPIGG